MDKWLIDNSFGLKTVSRWTSVSIVFLFLPSDHFILLE